MAMENADAAELLNLLLEDLRASVEILLALAMGATEYDARATLNTMGGEEVAFCCALHDLLVQRGVPVTWRINGIVLQALDLTHYDERLHLFAQHLRATREMVDAALAADPDPQAQRLLAAIRAAHTRHAAWSDEQAERFAQSRAFDAWLPRPAAPGPPSAQSGGAAATAPDCPDDPHAKGTTRHDAAPADREADEEAPPAPDQPSRDV